MMPWIQITHFGDMSIMSILALAIAGWLLAEEEQALALRWSLLFTACMVIVALTKIAFIGWGIGIRPLNFTGFSGHAARAAAVLPVLGYLALKRGSRGVRMSGVLAGVAFAVLIGVSRLAVHAHSISEVVGGLALGGVASGAFIMAAAPLEKPMMTRLRVALLMLMLLPAPYVQPAPTQKWLTKITLYVSGHDHPFHRYHWRITQPRWPTT